MNILLLVILLTWVGSAFSQVNSISSKDARAGGEENDFAYFLPYEKGKSFLLVQAYQSKLFSHKGEYALDFKMKKGTKICAARSGVVVEVKKNFKRGGPKRKYMSNGNHIIIKHDDGTFGNYWHLKYNGVLVNVGDTISQGQVIGFVGKTGYALFPHLHFEVTTQFSPGQHQIPTQFITPKGKMFLKPLHWYRRI